MSILPARHAWPTAVRGRAKIADRPDQRLDIADMPELGLHAYLASQFARLGYKPAAALVHLRYRFGSQHHRGGLVDRRYRPLQPSSRSGGPAINLSVAR